MPALSLGKLAQIFSFFTISRIQDSFLLHILATSAHEGKKIHLSRKGSTSGFSLGHPHCPHHCSPASGWLLSKLKVPRTRALRYQDSGCDAPDSTAATGPRGRGPLQLGDAEQEAESHWDSSGQCAMSCCSVQGTTKTHALFIYGIFHLMFSG